MAACDTQEEGLVDAAFVGTYMTGILKPFAENVEELHNTVLPLTENVQEIASRMEENTASVNEHRELLAALNAEMRKTSSELTHMQGLLGAVASAQDKENEPDTVAPRYTINEVAELLDQVKEQVGDLQHGLKETRSRLAKYQDGEVRHTCAEAQLRQAIEQLTAELKDLAGSQQEASDGVKAHKLKYQDTVQQLRCLSQEHVQQRQERIELSEKIDQRLKDFDDKRSAIQWQLDHHQDSHSRAHDNLQTLIKQMSAQDTKHRELMERVNKLETGVTDQRVVIFESKDNLTKLFQFIKNLEDSEEETRQMLAKLRNKSDEHDAAVRAFKSTATSVEQIVADMKLTDARCHRLEGMFELEPLTLDTIDRDSGLIMKGGVLITKEQFERYDKEFKRLDADGSGNIGVEEIGDLLKHMGFDPPKEFVEAKVKEIDQDGSGEIEFEEFCVLMAKCSDMEGAMERELQEMQERERKEQERVRQEKDAKEALANLRTTVGAHVDMFKETDIKHDAADRRIKNLEETNAHLKDQVKKLLDNFEVNQRNWKGFSQGLKDTHRSVNVEGEGQMLPSPERLRSNLLSPLSRRPRSLCKADSTETVAERSRPATSMGFSSGS